MDERTQLTQTCAQLWLNKAALCLQHSTDIPVAFEKFFSLFVAFNIMYSHAAIRLQEPNTREDKKHATRTFALWVGHERILAKLVNPGTADDLTVLPSLILRDGPFFLFWKPNARGVPERDMSKNRQLCQRLGSNQPVVRAEAILEYLYLVRCNIFHGTKALEASQNEILQPSIRCLEQIVELGMEKLTEEGNEQVNL